MRIRLNAFIVVVIGHVFTTSALLAEKNVSHDPRLLAGAATVFNTSKNAFSLPSANMPMMEQLRFQVGNSFFRNPWVIAPSTTEARDGVGPLLNTNGCQNCHMKDGRGHAPASKDDIAVSLLVRLSVPSDQGPKPEPRYGGQLQDFANPGLLPEGRIQIEYDDVQIKYHDGEVVKLRRPRIQIDQLAYGDLDPNVAMSARIATPMIGLGLLEAIPEHNILKNVDPDDKNKDGISGRPNYVIDRSSGEAALGRFGWKAGQPSVRQQSAAAFNGDLGVTSALFPKDDCTSVQELCLKADNGGDPELTEDILDAVTFYASNLGVPARRDVTKTQVQSGEALFSTLGCQSCHQAKWVTGDVPEMSWLSQQTIQPYTDLLLHDMGDGLADHRAEAQANGFEWRTPPLWGIGLAQQVHEEAGFLHDGRARTIEEAVLWHGGEAKVSQERFMALSKGEREALLAFLASL